MQEAKIHTQAASVQEISLSQKDGHYIVRDLFIYTSLVCNKSCHHCFVSSTPTNHTLDELSLKDLQPVFGELASGLGTQNIYFTGGEPFLAKEILLMIEAAMQYAPLTIYTNATRPLKKKLEELSKLNQRHREFHQKDILLRVSFDHSDPQIHDIYYGRGKGAWQESFGIACKAAKLGLAIAVTTQKDIHNRAPDSWVERAFSLLFHERGVELSDVKVLPDIPTGKHAQDPKTAPGPISVSEFAYSATPKSGLMCHTGRTLLKLQGRLQVFPCTLLVPDSPDAILKLSRYSMGTNLAESLPKPQTLDHLACRAYCVSGKQSCAN